MVAQLASELGDARRASAVEAFEALGVCKQLAEAAASLGWQSPSEIQAQSIPIVLKGVGVGRGYTRVEFRPRGRSFPFFQF